MLPSQLFLPYMQKCFGKIFMGCSVLRFQIDSFHKVRNGLVVIFQLKIRFSTIITRFK